MSHPIVEQILAGQAAPMVKQAAAKGALPIPREDLLELWGCLRNDSDPAIRILSRENLAAVKIEEWIEVLQSHAFREAFFEFAVKVLAKDARAAVALLRNRALPDAAVVELAKNSSPQITDLILDGQARLIECPAIVVSMLENPQISSTQGRRIFDLAEQFFRDHSEIPALVEQKVGLKVTVSGGPPAARPEPATKPAEEVKMSFPLSEEVEKETSQEESAEETDLPGEALKETLEQEEVKNLFQKILAMSVPKKVELALKGNKEARGILIRDSNKVVQEAVINSPKVTEQEIETIARMRNVPEEILRKISMMGEFMKKYAVMKALATNPRTPLAVTIPLISRFTELDMKFLLKDKNVSEALRREAKKLWEMKHNKKKVEFKKH